MLHADHDTLRHRIENDRELGPSKFRFRYLESYATAARTWLHEDAEVIDTTRLNPIDTAQRIVGALGI